ncbi:hypothetical protein G6F43_009813 [Rhizopus delemar]|nr:hypothetical protein G6F43_009813 [Rhizopus delemar]
MQSALNPFGKIDLCFVFYLDDICVLAKTKEEITNHTQQMIHHLEALGFLINKEKNILIPNKVQLFLVFQFDTQHMTIQVPREKNPKTGDQDSTTVENYKTSIMQVDSELDWENNRDDTGGRRSPSPCQIQAKGFSESTSKFKPQLGISLLPEHNKLSRIDMVDKQCASQELASDTIQAAKTRHHHLC